MEVLTMQVNILEAKTNLSNLVRLVETGREERIIIARSLGSLSPKLYCITMSLSQKNRCKERLNPLIIWIVTTMKLGCLRVRCGIFYWTHIF